MATRRAGQGPLVIADHASTGHRLWYVRLLVDEWRRHHDEPVWLVTNQDAEASESWRVNLGDLDGRAIRSVPLAGSRRRWRGAAMDAVRALDAGLLVLPSGDNWLPAMPMHRGFPVSCLIMRPRPSEGWRAGLRGRAKAVSAWAATRNARVTVWSLTMAGGGEAQFSVPDPVTLSTADGRRSPLLPPALADGAPVSLVVGELSRRKSLDQVLDAWNLVRDRRARLVLAGRVEPDQGDRVQRLAATDDRVCLMTRYLTELEFDALIQRADRLLALHRNPGSSGVALKGWAAGTPVTTLQGSYLHQSLVELGAAVEVVGAAAPPSALAKLLASPVPRAEPIDPARLRDRTARFTQSLLML